MERKCFLRGSVLPVVIVVSLLMLIGLGGLMSLWEQRALLAVRADRLRRARSDTESAYALYCRYPQIADTLREGKLLLYDSLPGSRVALAVRAWGLYETVEVSTSDSVMRTCRLSGLAPESSQTFYYADNRAVLTLAGRTVLSGRLRLPQNGIVYGRVNSDFYRGDELPRSALLRSEATLLGVSPVAESRIRALFAAAGEAYPLPADSLVRSFVRDSTAVFSVGNAELANCRLQGHILVYADELRIDASCRLEHLLFCARKVTVGVGVRMMAQVFARDTVILERGAKLGFPSGIYAGTYAEVGEECEVDGYVIVRDTVRRRKPTAGYRQAPTARLRGLLWVDGMAQVQGIVTGRAVLKQAAYFSPQGYYKDMLYDATLLENPLTTLPLWEQRSAVHRKEAAWLE